MTRSRTETHTNIKQNTIHQRVVKRELMAIICVLLQVVRICHRTLMWMLCRWRVRFAKAKLNEHILVIALILLRRMHATTHEVVAVLIVVLHRSSICAATGTSVDVVRTDAAVTQRHLRRIVFVLLRWLRLLCLLLDVGRREIGFAARLGRLMGIYLRRRILHRTMWNVLAWKRAKVAIISDERIIQK